VPAPVPVPGALSGPLIAESAIRRFRMPEKQKQPRLTSANPIDRCNCAACIQLQCCTLYLPVGRVLCGLFCGPPYLCEVRSGSASRSNQHGAASVAYGQGSLLLDFESTSAELCPWCLRYCAEKGPNSRKGKPCTTLLATRRCLILDAMLLCCT
jgi:hypothetical protein